MTALLRADWLRFRRRLDLWVILVGVLVVGGLGFLAGYRSDASDPHWPTPAEISQQALEESFFEGMTQAEIDAQIDLMVVDMTAMYEQSRIEWEIQQAVALQKYDLSEAPFTLVGSGLPALLALVLIGSLALGDEFRHGTIRSSLLAASDRRRFLAARLVGLLLVTIGLHLALVALAVVLAVLLKVVGAEVNTPAVPIDALSAMAWLGGLILVTAAVVAFGAMLTIILRSGALTLLVILLAGLIEQFVFALPIFRPDQFLAAVPQAFLTTNIQVLEARLGEATHAIPLVGAAMPQTVLNLDLKLVAAIIAAWGVVFLVIADRRIRSMDIVE